MIRFVCLINVLSLSFVDYKRYLLVSCKLCPYIWNHCVNTEIETGHAFLHANSCSSIYQKLENHIVDVTIYRLGTQMI